MIRKFCFLIIFLFTSYFTFAQQEEKYLAHLRDFRKKYVLEHEVVPKKDKKYFQFYKGDYKYRIESEFERIIDTVGFQMVTSSGKKKKYFIYGKVKFELDKKPLELFMYQSESLREQKEFVDYLFIPFTDSTTGDETYGAGRYIDLLITDLKDNRFILDFNKAYNPYCAYATGFNCPIPPRQNYLDFAVRAGEKDFGKKTH